VTVHSRCRSPRYIWLRFSPSSRRHPLLHVHAAYSDRFVDLVGEGFDAAVRLGFLPDSSLVARRICVIHGKYVASPSYIATHGVPKTPDDLLSHEALMQGTEIWRFMNHGKPILRHPHGRFKADNGKALLAAALAGLGVLVLPDFMIEPHVASGALVPPSSPTIRRPMQACMSSGRLVIYPRARCGC
jgi:DNA-binding transcriptional LysR family regulator